MLVKSLSAVIVLSCGLVGCAFFGAEKQEKVVTLTLPKVTKVAAKPAVMQDKQAMKCSADGFCPLSALKKK